jgi:hypothetical protein
MKLNICMKMLYTLIHFSYFLLLMSCKDPKVRRIIANDLIAEGEISSDTIYIGKIKFYDSASNRLVMDAVYEEGKLNDRTLHNFQLLQLSVPF